MRVSKQFRVKPFIFGLASLIVTGCIPDPPVATSIEPYQPVSTSQRAGSGDVRALDASTQRHLRDAALAKIFVDSCKIEGIKYRHRSEWGTTRFYFNQMRARGFTTQQIAASVARSSESQAVADARAYLRSRGVAADDPDRLCPLGIREARAGGRVGRLLRV